MNFLIFTVILLVGALLGGYTMAFQGASQFWGRRLVGAKDESEIIAEKMSEGMSEAEARGFARGITTVDTGVQDAITPQYQNLRNTLFFLFLVFSLIGGWIFFTWYIGILSFIFLFVLTGAFMKLFPSPDSDYFKVKIRNQLDKRRSKHLAQGDTLKAEACENFVLLFDKIC